jgi:hypothetical protein
MFFSFYPIYILERIVVAKIALDKLEAGMKLAKPVQNASGMVLLGENTELTAELIDRIKSVGIDSVYI